MSLRNVKRKIILFFCIIIGYLFQNKISKDAYILMYHSVADGDNLKYVEPSNHISRNNFYLQMKYIAKNKNVISLNELVSKIKSNIEIPPNSVVITFDDGYLDNLEVVAPILDEFGLKATLFLPVDYILRTRNQWIDRLYQSTQYRTNDILSYDNCRYDLSKSKEYSKFFKKCTLDLINLSDNEREYFLTQIEEQLLPISVAPRLTMNYDEVRLLLNNFSCFEIGSHSLFHSNMSILTEEQAETELRDSKQQLEKDFSIRIHTFSFCYGRTNENLRKLVKSIGYSCSCGGDGLAFNINSNSDIYRLPRIDVPESFTVFKILLNNRFPDISKKIMKNYK